MVIAFFPRLPAAGDESLGLVAGLLDGAADGALVHGAADGALADGVLADGNSASGDIRYPLFGARKYSYESLIMD